MRCLRRSIKWHDWFQLQRSPAGSPGRPPEEGIKALEGVEHIGYEHFWVQYIGLWAGWGGCTGMTGNRAELEHLKRRHQHLCRGKQQGHLYRCQRKPKWGSDNVMVHFQDVSSKSHVLKSRARKVIGCYRQYSLLLGQSLVGRAVALMASPLDLLPMPWFAPPPRTFQHVVCRARTETSKIWIKIKLSFK